VTVGQKAFSRREGAPIKSDEEVEESATGGAPRGVELPQQGPELPSLVLLLVAQNNLLRVQWEGAVNLKK
jgi:hypothetical protein